MAGRAEALAAGFQPGGALAVPLCPPHPHPWFQGSSFLSCSPRLVPPPLFCQLCAPSSVSGPEQSGGLGVAGPGANSASVLAQDPDSRGPPAPPPRDVPAAAQAPSPVSASRILPYPPRVLLCPPPSAACPHVIPASSHVLPTRSPHSPMSSLVIPASSSVLPTSSPIIPRPPTSSPHHPHVISMSFSIILMSFPRHPCILPCPPHAIPESSPCLSHILPHPP